MQFPRFSVSHLRSVCRGKSEETYSTYLKMECNFSRRTAFVPRAIGALSVIASLRRVKTDSDPAREALRPLSRKLASHNRRCGEYFTTRQTDGNLLENDSNRVESRTKITFNAMTLLALSLFDTTRASAWTRGG